MKKKNYKFVSGIDEKQEEYNFPDREKAIRDQIFAPSSIQPKTASPSLPQETAPPPSSMAYTANISEISPTKIISSAKTREETSISDIPATVTEAINDSSPYAETFIPPPLNNNIALKNQKNLKSKLFIIISAVLALIVIILLAIIISGNHTSVADVTTVVPTTQIITDNPSTPAIIVPETKDNNNLTDPYIELCYYYSDWVFVNKDNYKKAETEFVWDFMRALRDYAKATTKVTINEPQNIQDKPEFITENKEKAVLIFFTRVDDNLQPIDSTGKYPDCTARLLFTTQIEGTDLADVSAKTKYGVFLAYFDEANGGLDGEHSKFVDDFAEYFIDNCTSKIESNFKNHDILTNTTETSAPPASKPGRE